MKALLLDLDGTVIDTHEMIYACYRETVRQHLGFAPDRSLLARGVGLPLEEIFADVLQSCGRQSPTPEELTASYRERLLQMDDALRVFPDIPPVLEALRQRSVRLAIVTTKLGSIARRHLHLLDLDRHFEAIITRDDCLRCKPDPEPFQRAVQALGLAPESAAGVGDSAHDIRSARGAGLRAVAACWGTMNRASLLGAEPDLALESPKELLRLVE